MAEQSDTVFVIDTEDRMVWGVADSITAAVAHIKAAYPEPFVVGWDEPRTVGEGDATYTVLSGKFGAVPGYSTKHVAAFFIEPYEIIRGGSDG